jgi:hypothetical protein
MEERRQGERREDERREFRREEGRRDSETSRRRSKLRYLLPAGVLVIILLAGLAFRTLVVAPRRSAALRGADAWHQVDLVLSASSLPMLALPGAGPPAAGDPGEPLPDPGPDQATLLSQLNDELTPALRTAPSVGAVPRALGPARLLLGQEREARIAWEALLAHSVGDRAAEARVGLGVVAIRAASRAGDDLDRRFALEQAVDHLHQAVGDPASSAAARFDLAVALCMLGDVAAAREHAAAVPEPARTTLLEWLDGR